MHVSQKHEAGREEASSLCHTGRFCCSARLFVHTMKCPPWRPQTSISVFPWELPPGARGQSAASCQPRNVTSPQTRTRLLPHSPVVASSPLRQFAFASPPPAEEGTRPGETRWGRERGCVSMHVCVCNCSFCVYECSSLWKF